MLFSNISLRFNDKTILPNLSQGRLAAPLSIWRLCALYTLHAGAARPCVNGIHNWINEKMTYHRGSNDEQDLFSGDYFSRVQLDS
jgi:hypothetical protein